MAGNGQKLTPKQKAFVDEYLIDLNASAAARRAGYKTRSDSIAAQNMLKPVIQAAIQRRMADREKRTEITQDRVLQEYACLAFNDPRQYFNESGDLVPISELSQEAAAAISGFDARVVKGEDGTECTIMKIKLSDKRASLNDVARHLGMFLEDNKQKGPSEILVTLEPDND